MRNTFELARAALCMHRNSLASRVLPRSPEFSGTVAAHNKYRLNRYLPSCDRQLKSCQDSWRCWPSGTWC